MKVISIDFNESNNKFTDHESYLDSADKYRLPLLSIVSRRGARRWKGEYNICNANNGHKYGFYGVE